MSEGCEGRRCYLYVLNTLADWEIGYLTAELKSRRFIPEDRNPELVIVGNTVEPVFTMGGFPVKPDKSVDEIIFREGDALILPGGDTWNEEENRKVLDLLPALLEKKVLVAAICGATAALAEEGLLDKRRHTSNDREFLEMFCPSYRGSAFYQDDLVVSDDNLITASGLAPLEFSCEIFRKIDAMRVDTLKAWYKLYQTKESRYYFSLMESLS